MASCDSRLIQGCVLPVKSPGLKAMWKALGLASLLVAWRRMRFWAMKLTPRQKPRPWVLGASHYRRPFGRRDQRHKKLPAYECEFWPISACGGNQTGRRETLARAGTGQGEETSNISARPRAFGTMALISAVGFFFEHVKMQTGDPIFIFRFLL